MNKVAVVVPMHNAEENLVECLDSIKNQTLKDISIICVDDFSQDNTSAIAESFAQKDNRFKLIKNEENLGAGRTRNRGMEYVDASYVVFWDSDEYYCDTLLEEMYNSAMKHNADVVLAERGILNSETGKVTSEASRKYFDDGYSEKAFNIHDLPFWGLGMWPSSPINRMVRKSLIDKYEIRFQDLRSSNDVFYADMATLLADKVIHIDNWEPMIYVRRNLAGSISSNRDPFCSFKAFKGIKDRLIELEKWEEFQRYVCVHYTSAIFAELKKCKKEELQKAYFKFTKEEGLYEIYGKENGLYILTESRYANQMTVFCNSEFGVKCWEPDYKTRYVLYKSKEALRTVFFEYSLYGKKVGLYSKDKSSAIVLDFIKQNYKIEIEAVDLDKIYSKDVIVTITKDDYNMLYRQFNTETANISVEIFMLYEYLKGPKKTDFTRNLVPAKVTFREVCNNARSLKEEGKIEKADKEVVACISQKEVIVKKQYDPKETVVKVQKDQKEIVVSNTQKSVAVKEQELKPEVVKQKVSILTKIKDAVARFCPVTLRTFIFVMNGVQKELRILKKNVTGKLINDLDKTYKLVKEVLSKVNKTNKELTDKISETHRLLKEVSSKVNGNDKLLEEVLRKVGKIDERLEQMSQHVIEEKEGLSRKIDERLEQMSQHVTEEKEGLSRKIDERLEQMSQHVTEEKEGLSRKISEILWAEIFNSAITHESWLKDRDFAPGRWAVGYGYLYVMYRILNQMSPMSILELGLGQSTKMITQYSKSCTANHYVVEHDPKWIDFFLNENEIADTTNVLCLDREMIEYSRVKEVRVFKDFYANFSGMKFDFISIDAPLGGDMPFFSRIDVLQIMPDCLNDSFVILLDDVNRSGERNTAKEISRILKKADIKFKTRVYTGETEFQIWCSEDNAFLCTV